MKYVCSLSGILCLGRFGDLTWEGIGGCMRGFSTALCMFRVVSLLLTEFVNPQMVDDFLIELFDAIRTDPVWLGKSEQ